MPNEIYHKSNWGNANAGEFGDVYFDAAATNKLYNHSDYYENSNGTDKILRDLSNKASIVLTPTAYSDGSLNTVIPTDGNGDFDFSRGSSATRVNEQGLIEDVQILSGELVQNGNFEEIGQNWSVTNADADNYVEFGNGTARLKFLNTSPVTTLATSFVMTAGKKYKLTVDVLTVTSGGIKVDGSGISETFNVAGITTRIINPTANTQIKFYRATANVDITLNSVSLIEITDDTDLPRIDYSSGFGSLLLEPSRTNSLLYSNLFTWSGWSKAGAGTGSAPTVTGDYAISPDGSQNASRLQLDKGSGTTTSDYSFMYETVTSVGTGSISIWMKSNDSNTYQVALREANFIVCDVTPEWQRFELNNQASTNEIQIMLRGTYGTSNNADILIYGAQLEEGSYATSYIPTSGSTVTRSADVANNSGNADLINSTEGVLYAEIAALANDGTNRAIAISDGTTSNEVRFYYSTTDNRIVGSVKSGGSSVFNFNNVLSNAVDFIKLAIKYKANDFKMYVNGVEVSAVTSGAAPVGLEELAFDNGAGNDDFFGRCKTVAVFKEALTDAELQALTS